MWIDDGEKYALVGLEVKQEGEPPLEHIAPNLWVLTTTTFDVPDTWRKWLGSIRADEVAGCNLFLVSKLASATPGVLDGENQALERRVGNFYVGLLLSAMFSPAHKPVMLTGARHDGEVGVRQHSNLDRPLPQVIRPYPPVMADDILWGAELGEKLGGMQAAIGPDGHSRLFRTLHIYVQTRAMREPLDRIHQYCRCIEGLILPAIGKTRKQFKSRTELFIGPTHHELMGALYDVRSHVEHLHEYRYLEPFDRDVRLDLMGKEAIVEYIARAALVRIISNEALSPHFVNTAALKEFWSLSRDKRRKHWGNPIDPMMSISDFDPDHLHDGHLGKTD